MTEGELPFHNPGCDCLIWVFDRLREIRAVAGNDAAKVDELTRDPRLEREIRELYPDDWYALKVLEFQMDTMRILAKHGVFIDYPKPFDDL